MNDTTVGLAGVPFVVGLVAVCTEAGMPARFAPLATVGFGILYAATVIFATPPGSLAAGYSDMFLAIAAGITLGLGALGLYTGAGQVKKNFFTPQDQTAPSGPTADPQGGKA